LLGKAPPHDQELRTAYRQSPALQPAEDLAGQAAPHRVRLDEDECPLRGHGSGILLRAPSPPSRWRRSRRLDGRIRELHRRWARDGRLAVRAELPERLERRLAVRARLLQPRGADRADAVAGVDLRAADRTAQVAAPKALLHRPDLELALPHLLEVLGRP